jgi:hypothetical protein
MANFVSQLLGIFPLPKKMTVDADTTIEAPYRNHKKAAMLFHIILDHVAGPQWFVSSINFNSMII